MNIKEIMQQGAVQVVVSAADLKEAFMAWTNENTTTTKEDIMLTSYEVAQKFGVTKSTLWRWQQSGYLVPIKVGRKSFYKSSEVEQLVR